MKNWRSLFCGQEEFFSRYSERARWAQLGQPIRIQHSLYLACNVTYPLRTNGETPVPSRPITIHYPYSYSDFSRSGGTYKQTLGRSGYEINLNPGRKIIMPLIFPNGFLSLIEYAALHYNGYIPANFFRVKCVTFSSYQRLLNISDDFPKTSELWRKCTKMFRQPLSTSQDIIKTTIFVSCDTVRTQGQQITIPFCNTWKFSCTTVMKVSALSALTKSKQ